MVTTASAGARWTMMASAESCRTRVDKAGSIGDGSSRDLARGSTAHTKTRGLGRARQRARSVLPRTEEPGVGRRYVVRVL